MGAPAQTARAIRMTKGEGSAKGPLIFVVLAAGIIPLHVAARKVHHI
jgi:hypothetical protein